MISAITVSNELSVLLNFVACNYFFNSYCTCILWRTTAEPAPILNYEFNHHVDSAQFNSSMECRSISIPQIRLNFENGDSTISLMAGIQTAVNSGCQSWIVLGTVGKVFLTVYKAVVDRIAKQRHPRVRFVFYVPRQINEPNLRTESLLLKDILNHPALEDVPDVLLVTPSSRECHFDLITSQFVGRLGADTSVFIDSVFVDAVRSAVYFEHSKDTQLFEVDKLQNLQRRHLKLALFNYKPYTTITKVPPGTGNANDIQVFNNHKGHSSSEAYEENTLLLEGTECLVFLELCKKLNCTLLISLNDEDEWGEIFDNWTGNGIIGAVVNKQTEVGIGAVFPWHREYQFLSYSVPVSRSGVTSLVPKPQIVDPILLALLPFSGLLWLAVLLSYLLAVLSLTLAGKFHSQIHNLHENGDNLYIKSTFLVMGIYLLQPINYWTTDTAKRILLATILVGGLVIGFSFSGALASIMTIPQYEPSIDSSAQLAASNIKWGATHEAWVYTIKRSKDTDPVMRRLYENFEVRSKEELENRNTDGHFGFAVERLSYGYFGYGDFIKPKSLEVLRLMKEDIYFENCVAVCKRNWYLLPKFDDLVLRLAQSGIQKYWLMNLVYQQLDPVVQRGFTTNGVNHHDNQGPRPLSVFHVAGIFYVWLFGMAIASFVFLAEKVIARPKSLLRRPFGFPSFPRSTSLVCTKA